MDEYGGRSVLTVCTAESAEMMTGMAMYSCQQRVIEHREVNLLMRFVDFGDTVE